MRLKFTLLLVCVLCLAVMSSACGQKGDLYLPDPQEKKQKKPS
ncbi:MAG: LPS translocon maturation chaperone LptM [Gammaproteobacteria bacterium]